MENNKLNKIEISNEIRSLSRVVHEGTVLDEMGRTISITTEVNRKIYRQPYHDKLDILRKDKSNCGRCGKPNNNGYRTCDKCRNYSIQYKKVKKIKLITVDNNVLDILIRRIASLELAMARLQLNKRDAYLQGYRTAQKHERKIRYVEIPEISKQELATINHAYCSIK